MTDSSRPQYSDDLIQALTWAARRHQRQTRKTSPTPYIAHVVSVMALVFENGGTEAEAIAGLLHDLLEDTSTESHEIEEAFGPEIAFIVEECTDPIGPANGTWAERKRAKLARVPTMSDSAILVYSCDKLHNLRQMSEDMQKYGPDIWDSTGGGYAQTLGYYSAYVDALGPRLVSHPVLLAQLRDARRLAIETGLSLGLHVSPID